MPYQVVAVTAGLPNKKSAPIGFYPRLQCAPKWIAAPKCNKQMHHIGARITSV